MPEQHQYKGIVIKLASLQTKIAYLGSARGLFHLFGLILISFGVLSAITAISWLPISARVAIDIVLAIAFSLFLYFGVIQPYFNRPGFLTIARLLEAKYGAFQSRLIAALELYDLAGKNRENYSLELINKTIEEAGGVIAEIDTEAVINYKPLYAALGRAGIILVLALAGFFINSDTVYQTWLLYSRPAANFAKPPNFGLMLKPDGGEFYRNMDLAVKANVTGRIPRHVDLFYRFENGAWISEAMTKPDSISDSSFVFTFKKVKRSLDIYARSGAVETPKVHIDIVDPPRLTDINLKFVYPQYSGLPNSKGNPNDGNISALRGTKVSIEATANKPLKECSQLYADSARVQFHIDGDRIDGDFIVKTNGRYTLILRDEAGRQNPEPIWYDIQALEDYPPAIVIKFPAADVDLNEQMTLPLVIDITDDYGFGKINLVYWTLSEEQQTEPVKQSLNIPDKKSLDQEISFNWNLQTLNPLPGDLIYYYCEVSDNDIISGPKWAKSKTYSARLPNLDEILADVQGSQEQQMETVEEALKSQKELQKQIEDISREMLKATDVNWEKQQEAKKVLEKQQDLAKKLENLSQEMQNNLEKLEDNKLISEQIAEKMQELQQLMEEVAPPELKEAMQKLQDAIQNMDPAELKKALEQLQMSAQQMLENLDRALSLMQKLAIEQKMDMLVQMAEKIAQQQEMINKSVDAAADSSSLAKQLQPEKNTADEFNILKDQFSDLQKMDKEQEMIPQKEEQEAENQVNNPEIPENFESMKSGMQCNSQGNCKNKGKKLQGQLKNMGDALKQAQAAMQKKQKLEIAKKMQKAAEDLLYLSDRQEILLDSTRNRQNTGDGLRKMASSQMQIAGASSRVANMVSELSKETVFINLALMKLLGMSLSDMSDAINHLDKRFAPGAVQSEQSAMSNLNKTVYLLFQARDNAMSSGSGSGMQELMQQMKQMSQMQAGINDQTMMAMPQPGMQLNMGQQQALRNQAAQQEMLRQQLQNLSDEFGKRGEMLGRLDQLGEEMKKVVDDLQKSRVSQETIKRQEGILSRLLDAQKSVNRRDFSKRRQAEQGTDMLRKSPNLPENFTGDSGWLSDMVKKALDEQYPRQYEKLIRAYFKSFQTREVKADE